MVTFPYCDSLKYEVEKDYINNYGRIQLDSGLSIGSEIESAKKQSHTSARFPIFKAFTKNVSLKGCGIYNILLL